MIFFCSECGSRAEVVDQVMEYDQACLVIQCTNDLDMFEPGACVLVYNGCTELVPIDPGKNNSSDSEE